MMEKNLSETSLNYLEILIPPITKTLTQSQTPVDSTTNATIQEWKAQFRQQQLHICNRLRQATYHWVAHLLTEHSTQIYHPTFGLTPIAEPTSTTNILAIPRSSLEETIVIPAATQCTECRAACKEIQSDDGEESE